MAQALSHIWQDYLRPIFRRPDWVQVAALCYRRTATGKDVLLITSRDTGRWILPKGWPVKGMDGPGAALREAWEEAGVAEARVEPHPVGTFSYAKRLDSGGIAPVRAEVYLTEVGRLESSFPECAERSRTWVSPRDAANMVQEPGLKKILLDF